MDLTGEIGRHGVRLVTKWELEGLQVCLATVDCVNRGILELPRLPKALRSKCHLVRSTLDKLETLQL